MDGDFRPDVFDKALNYVVGRHPIMRSVIDEEREKPRFKVFKTVPEVHARHIDVSHLPPSEERAYILQRGLELNDYRFDLGEWPLFFCEITKFANDRYVFAMNIDHMLVDGFSYMQVFDELFNTYDRMVLGEPDEKGRRKPVGTGEFETLAVDSVIGAIGQTVDWGTLDTGALTTTKKGTAEADALTYQTAQPDIFVGGDCYTGPKFAIDAIAAGKEAAISLHRYVHPGQTLTAGRDRRVYKALDKEHVLIETADFDKDHRQMPGYNAAKAKTFSDARVTFTEEQVRRECARCLGCGATKVDSYLCIGCGLCTTKCKFDAIHLKKVRDWHAGSYETMPIKVAEGVVKRAGSIVKKAVSK